MQCGRSFRRITIGHPRKPIVLTVVIDQSFAAVGRHTAKRFYFGRSDRIEPVIEVGHSATLPKMPPAAAAQASRNVPPTIELRCIRRAGVASMRYPILA